MGSHCIHCILVVVNPFLKSVRRKDSSHRLNLQSDIGQGKNLVVASVERESVHNYYKDALGSSLYVVDFEDGRTDLQARSHHYEERERLLALLGSGCVAERVGCLDSMGGQVCGSPSKAPSLRPHRA